MGANAEAPPTICADLNDDGVVNFLDLSVLKDQFLNQCTREEVSVVPEIVCSGFVWQFGTGEPIPDNVTDWPFNTDYVDPWLSAGAFPNPRPDSWEFSEDFTLKPCFIRANDRMIPINLLLDWDY